MKAINYIGSYPGSFSVFSVPHQQSERIIEFQKVTDHLPFEFSQGKQKKKCSKCNNRFKKFLTIFSEKSVMRWLSNGIVLYLIFEKMRTLRSHRCSQRFSFGEDIAKLLPGKRDFDFAKMHYANTVAEFKRFMQP